MLQSKDILPARTMGIQETQLAFRHVDFHSLVNGVIDEHRFGHSGRNLILFSLFGDAG